MLLQERLYTTRHAKAVSAKAKTLINGLAKVAKENWGLNRETIMTIYKGAILPMLTYATKAWAHNI